MESSREQPCSFDTESNSSLHSLEAEMSETEIQDEPAILELPLDPTLELDTTKSQVEKLNKDIQGIHWETTQYTRPTYRYLRNRQYVSYFNEEQAVRAAAPIIDTQAHKVTFSHEYYEFVRNWRSVNPTYSHFQLRNLVWAVTSNDLIYVSENRVMHWNAVTGRTTPVIDVSGLTPEGLAPNGLGKVHLCTLCAKEGLIATGGFAGELIVCRMGWHEPFYVCSKFVATPPNNINCITNAIEIFKTPTGAVRIVCSNNDEVVRIFDGTSCGVLQDFHPGWAVNFTASKPDEGHLLCVVGDDPQAKIYDCRTNETAAQLNGHYDYSFSAAWHPDGNVIATGNQDMTVRLWDIRKPDASFLLLKAHLGAVRSLRFSSNGKFLAVAEPNDYVTIYDCSSMYSKGQMVDFFGEVAGISFSPDSEEFFIGITDLQYNSVLQLSSSGA